MIHFMLDLETVGTLPGSAIASIGVQAFDPFNRKADALLGPGFYRAVDLRSCQKVGLTLDADTVYWWLSQSDEARAALCVADTSIQQALSDLDRYLLDNVMGAGSFKEGDYTQQLRVRNNMKLWCHGAGFDEPLLKAAYRACGLVEPWDFRNVRDTRTIYDPADVRPERSEGTHHHALDDARAQALAVSEAYHVMNIGPFGVGFE